LILTTGVLPTVSVMLLNLLIFLTSECTQLYSRDAAAHTNFADKENMLWPPFSCALAIHGQIGNPRPGALLEAFAGGHRS
jgi:hypothetical protein